MIRTTGILFFLTTALCAFGAFFAGIQIARKNRAKIICWIGAALSFVLIKSVFQFVPEWEAIVFPWPVYVYFQGFWLYPIALFFLGLAVAYTPRERTRCYLKVFSIVVFLCSFWENIWMIIPFSASSTQTADQENHCRQTTGYTCVPAACVSLLSYWGIPATEGEMALLCRTRYEGTTTFDSFYGLKLKLRKMPFKVQIINLDVLSFQALNIPALCTRDEHAFVLKYENDLVTLQDPLAQSRIVAPLHNFQKEITGPAVIILPTE